MTYLRGVETYGVEDGKYFRQWSFLDKEERTQVFLLAAEMEDVHKRQDVVEMNLREVSEVVSEGTLQGMVDGLFERMEPILKATDVVRIAVGEGLK